MTAKEMFEKLGFKYENKHSSKNCKVYLKKIDIDGWNVITIIFTKDKENKKYINIDGVISLKELQAINKQVEELGWNK